MKRIIQFLTVGGLALGAAYGQSADAGMPAGAEQSRELYIAGDYAAARKGFEKVLAADADNPVARYYMEKMAEHRQMTAEEKSLNAVQDAWNGMVFRDYALSAAARQALRVADAAETADVTGSFPEVSFPAKAYAVYRPGLNRLFVLNTPSNIQKMESILTSMDEPHQGDGGQVEIEARFVEFNEGALEELGFNWSDAVDGNAVNAGGDWSVADGENLFTGALRTMPFDQTGTLGPGETRAAGEWSANRLDDMFNSTATGSGTLDLSGSIAGNMVDLLIRALDQTAGTDVLSAPGIVTLSGQPAVITVGERHFYPEVYEAGESQGTVLHVQYQDFKEKILGVEMTVTPVIKGKEIQMKINPRITELLGWQQFELAPADTSYTYYQYRVGMQFEHEPVVAQLPLFNRREVKTEVTVASGATIGMGGLIGEKTEAFSDRVPVLGSIPLIGRLFRSEGERSVKRNLMIFVTASQVAPNGRILSDRSFAE